MPESIGDYEEGIANALKLQEERHRHVGTLNQLGQSLRSNLTDIMESAYKDDDARSAYMAGKTQQSYSLARLFVQKFLIENDVQWAEQASASLQAAIDDGLELVSSLDNVRRLQLAEGFLAGVQQYSASFDAVTETILARNAIISGTLGTIGPQIAKVVEDVKLSAKDEQDTLGPQAVAAIEKDIDAIRTVSEKAGQSMQAVCDAIQQVSTAATAIAGAMEEQSATTSEKARNTGMSATGSQDVLTAIGDVTQKGAAHGRCLAKHASGFTRDQ